MVVRMDISKKEALPLPFYPVVWVGAHAMLTRAGDGSSGVVVRDCFNDCCRCFAEQPLGLPLFQDRVFRGVSGMSRGPFPGCPGVCPGCSRGAPGAPKRTE